MTLPKTLILSLLATLWFAALPADAAPRRTLESEHFTFRYDPDRLSAEAVSEARDAAERAYVLCQRLFGSEPARTESGFLVEIRRASREDWRAGRGSPYYVVADRTPESALAAARSFVYRHG